MIIYLDCFSRKGFFAMTNTFDYEFFYYIKEIGFEDFNEETGLDIDFIMWSIPAKSDVDIFLQTMRTMELGAEVEEDLSSVIDRTVFKVGFYNCFKEIDLETLMKFQEEKLFNIIANFFREDIQVDIFPRIDVKKSIETNLLKRKNNDELSYLMKSFT
jgi:hypothetical protein